MTFTQTVLAELQNNPKLDEATQIAISAFMEQHESLIDAASDDVRQAFFVALGRGDPVGAWDVLSAGLSSAQILEHLRDTQVEFAALTAARQQAVTQFQSVMDSAGKVAIGLLVKAALALL